MNTPDPSTKRAIATSVLMFAAFMDLLDVTIVNVALPAIRSDLDASPAHLEWILGGYTLTFAVLLITGGRLGDIFGRQRIFVLGVTGFTLASLAACLSGNGETLVAARIVQGGVRRDDGAAAAVDRAGHLRAEGARERLRHRRRRVRHGRGRRPAAGRLAHHERRVRRRLAQHLPDQHPGRHRADRARAEVRTQHRLGAGDPPRPARRRPGDGRRVPAGLPADRGPRAGLARLDLGDVRRRGFGPGRVRRQPAAHRTAHAVVAPAHASVRQPRLLGRHS